MTASVFTMARIILRSSLTTASVLGLFLVSIHLWGNRGIHEKPEVPLKIQARLSERQSFPERSHIAHVSVSVSSNSFMENEQYSPEHLMEEGRTIWHAEQPPKYPQWVEISFLKPTVISHLGIRSQGDSPGGKEHCRSPKEFVFQATHDPNIRFKERRWNDLCQVKNNHYVQGEAWKDWFFENSTAYRFYRIYITAGGDPDFLTIRQIRLDNATEHFPTVESAPSEPVQVVPAISKGSITAAIQPTPTFGKVTQRTVLNPPKKFVRAGFRERFDKLMASIGVKTKEEAMDFCLDFWEKRRKAYSL